MLVKMKVWLTENIVSIVKFRIITECSSKVAPEEISWEWTLKLKCKHCPVTLLVCSKQLPQEGHGLINCGQLREYYKTNTSIEV